MGIKIHMLNVGDADAIIVQLTKGHLKMILLVDGGKNEGHADQIISYFERIKDEPSIIINTHLDQDHIGGLPKILRKYKSSIQSIWTHLPEKHYHEGSFKKALMEKAGVNEGLQLVLASVQDLNNFIDVATELGLNKKIVEPFSDSKDQQLLAFCALWGIDILGPSVNFYESLVPDILKEYDSRIFECGVHKATANPCDLIGQDGDDTPTNESSLIFQINSGNKYLFTGDAGLRAFRQVKDNLGRVYWLKVPHHGSGRNLNSDLIGRLSPNKCFISAVGLNGHPDANLKRCLGRYAQVECTGESNVDLIEER